MIEPTHSAIEVIAKRVHKRVQNRVHKRVQNQVQGRRQLAWALSDQRVWFALCSALTLLSMWGEVAAQIKATDQTLQPPQEQRAVQDGTRQPLLIQPISITDDRGVTTLFAQSPQRVVSLLPSLTETVCSLGHCARLVGVDRYSNMPDSVKALPQLGGGLDPSVEAIVALRPDVVLVAKSTRVTDRLVALGLKVVALEPQTHADVERALALLGRLLGVADPGRAWREIDASMRAATAALPPQLRGVSVYFEVDSAPYAAGEASFIGQTLTRLGVANIVPKELGAFPKLNPEFVVRANPQFILVGEGSAAALRERPGWAAIRAVRSGRVCAFTREQSDLLVRPGPRLALAAQLMLKCLVGTGADRVGDAVSKP